MSSLQDIASVQIALNTAAVARGTFGVMLIASPHASAVNRVLSYNKYDDAVSDNLPPVLLTALSDAFAQIPHPNVVKVGRMSVQKVAIAPVDAVANAVYSLKLGSTPISVTAAASPTTSTIATQLATAINTAAVGVTATAVAGVVELTFTGAIVPPNTFTKIQWDVITPSATAGIVGADLTAINEEDGAWYALALTERTKQRVLDAAAWTETQEKIFGTATADPNAFDAANTSDVITALRASQYFRTYVGGHKAANTEFVDVAWPSRVLTIQPGAETWALKRLASVTPDKLSATEKNAVISKGGNTFEFYQPQIALTNPGKVAAGEWIDIIRFRDWLKDHMQTGIVQMMINRDKVPYTDGGLQLIGAKVRESLRAGQAVGGIAPDELDADGKVVPGFFVNIPLSAEVDAVTKASRVAYITFGARIAGAIHVANITGSLSYELN